MASLNARERPQRDSNSAARPHGQPPERGGSDRVASAKATGARPRSCDQCAAQSMRKARRSHPRSMAQRRFYPTQCGHVARGYEASVPQHATARNWQCAVARPDDMADLAVGRPSTATARRWLCGTDFSGDRPYGLEEPRIGESYPFGIFAFPSTFFLLFTEKAMYSYIGTQAHNHAHRSLQSFKCKDACMYPVNRPAN
ncbi:hypothetical protein VPH35_029076 [Triticum aestivum]